MSRPNTISSTVDTLRRAPVGPFRGTRPPTFCATCSSAIIAIGTPLCDESSTVRFPAASGPARFANVAGASGASKERSPATCDRFSSPSAPPSGAPGCFRVSHRAPPVSRCSDTRLLGLRTSPDDVSPAASNSYTGLYSSTRSLDIPSTPSTVSVNGLSIFRWCRLVYVCPCLARIFSLRFSSLPAAPFSGTGGPGVIEWSRRLGKRTIVREKERRRLRSVGVVDQLS